MSTPHPAPVIASVLQLLAERLEARADNERLNREDSEVPIALMAVAEEIRQIAKELK